MISLNFSVIAKLLLQALQGLIFSNPVETYIHFE